MQSYLLNVFIDLIHRQASISSSAGFQSHSNKAGIGAVRLRMLTIIIAKTCISPSLRCRRVTAAAVQRWGRLKGVHIIISPWICHHNLNWPRLRSRGARIRWGSASKEWRKRWATVSIAGTLLIWRRNWETSWKRYWSTRHPIQVGKIDILAATGSRHNTERRFVTTITGRRITMKASAATPSSIDSYWRCVLTQKYHQGNTSLLSATACTRMSPQEHGRGSNGNVTASKLASSGSPCRFPALCTMCKAPTIFY